VSSEIITEEGIVVSVENGIADIIVVKNEGCNDCHASIICKPASGNENIIKAIDTIGVKSGMHVRFEIKGGALLGASFLLYGIPLLLLLIGIFLGMSLFSEYKGKELLAFMFGLGLMALFFILNYYKSKADKSNSNLPVITSVKE
jgi:sigma-E factor negative regulatory protein RseC